MALIIDPPSGWMFGFPRPIPKDIKDVRDWLIENGYPKEAMDKYGEYFHCRYWEEPDNNSKIEND